MIKRYTKSEMLAHWRRAFSLDASNAGVDIESFEGIDSTAELLVRMRAWYLNLLDSAPLHLIPVESLSLTASLRQGAVLARAQLPAATRRVVWVEHDSWLAGTVPLPAEKATHALRRLASPYARPGEGEPIAVTYRNYVDFAPAPSLTINVRAVVDPGPEVYELDDSLLPTTDMAQT